MCPGNDRWGHVFFLNDPQLRSVTADVRKVKKTFGELNFTFDNDISLNTANDLQKEFKKVITAITGGLHLMYIVASVCNSNIVDKEGVDVDVRGICESAKGTNGKIIIFLQLNIQEKDDNNSTIHLNQKIKASRGGSGESLNVPPLVLPQSSDMLLAYLPRVVGQKESIVDTLCETLKSFKGIDECLVALAGKMSKKGQKQIPTYSTTMRAGIPLNPEATENQEYSWITEKGISAAFLIEKFEGVRNKGDISDLDACKDEKSLSSVSALFDFKIQMGEINKKSIFAGVEDAVGNVGMKKAPLLTITISTHGDGRDLLYASDDSFNIKDIMERVKPLGPAVTKLIIIDACRGWNTDSPKRDSSTPGGMAVGKERGLTLPENTLLIRSSTEGNRSYSATQIGSILIEKLCGQIFSCKKGAEVNLFDVLHEVMTNVADLKIGINELGQVIKQQVTFASTLAKPLRFKVPATQ